ncbi:hypothetical protein Y032_0106g3768 [Ancylostoma ceylanicum]|uniref:Guanylate cyclase n=1 Tax=Ancylostoma ceylanicum TaxID=53326 RepID=A0A016TFY3_9BILA|nr:hypothetical protein Y032_0106g3768 [Ancylostoma ceylanicum]
MNFILFLTFFLVTQDGFCKILNVGLLCAYNNTEITPFVGWKQTAGAVGVAWDKIQADGLLPSYNVLNLTWVMGECVESTDAGAVIAWAQTGGDVVLGPACSASALVSGTVGKYFNFPIIVWAPTYASDLLDTYEYPTAISSTFSSINQAQVLLQILGRYQWSEIALIYYASRSSLIPRCSLVMTDLEDLTNGILNLTITYRRQLLSYNNDTFRSALKSIRDVSRITIACFESDEARRNFLVAIAEAGMDTEEYMWIMIESRKAGFANIWRDTKPTPDGKDAIALRAARRIFVIDVEPLNSTAEFIADVKQKMTEPPYNCNDCTDIDPTVSQVGELADAMLLYAVALNKSLASGIAKPTGTDLARFAMGTFEGFTGTVIINQNLSRDPVFYVWGLNTSDQEVVLMKITGALSVEGVVISEMQPPSVIWVNHGGSPPLNRPHCGFDGKACPPSFVEQYLAVTLASIAVGLVLIAIIAAAVIYIMRTKRKEQERLNLLWQIPFISLQKPNQKSGATSSRSLQSSMSTSTKLTIDSKRDTTSHSFFTLGNDSIVARKHKVRTLMNKNDCAALRKMRSTDHDNLCRFIGLCMDSPELLSLWRYCARGSLKDVIEKGSLQMDWFFKYSLIRDISEGIYFLHHSQFGAHGWISSSTCLVDERWQVKITYYGLDTIKALEIKEPKRLVWAAPEHIRDPMMPPTKEGDIYSFAIVCSEIVTKRAPWDLDNQDYDLDELIYKVKRGGRAPIRPSLDTDDEHNASLSLLIRDCWSEEPEQRPSCDQVRTLIKGFNQNKSSNLMDHVFNVLEQYASNLEEEVQARMKELTEEKKKSDILLYRMLPNYTHQEPTKYPAKYCLHYFSVFYLIAPEDCIEQNGCVTRVAEKLKLGQSVEPETFDCVTLFFSDVVSFTTLASRCTPLQVVNLLNDLYTVFDAIIDEHDVYKVETIGDGYLCVSGLPHRNGNEHAKEIAEMSFSLLRAIRVFRIPHLPDEKINIRVGLHTGPVVTGVVGMTMPRYCLFGDTVNTASRMESNGKPGRVHISSDTKNFLTEKIGGYKTELRGEVIVKEKYKITMSEVVFP